MAKLAIATHGNMAQGVKHTIGLLIGQEEITALCCFGEELTTPEAIQGEIRALLSGTEEEVIVFTDMKGGSVNRAVCELIPENDRLHVVAGFNLITIMEVIYAEGSPAAYLAEAVARGKEEMVYMNQVLEG